MKITVVQIQLNQERLKFQVIIREILLTLLIFSILSTVVIIAVPSVLGITVIPGNRTSSAGNMTFIGNMTGGKSMMMPGGNMTFGASLQNAKMHLMGAIMYLKTGNTKGAMIELNLAGQAIKMHQQEIKGMMMEVKSIMTQMKGNATLSSMVSKNATS